MFVVDERAGTIRFNGTVDLGATAISADDLPIFQATFKVLANGGLLDLLETNDLFSMFPNDAGPSTNIYAAELVDGYVTTNSHSVTVTVSMQGRSVRSGVPGTLTGLNYGPYLATSTNVLSNNLVFSGVAEGDYIFTTLQPRYLNVPAVLDKTFTVILDKVLPTLALKGGNAIWSDDVINVQDASLIGSLYKIGDIDDDADVNFDNKVDILDLTLVGGNYRLTSGVAYATWVP